MMKAAYITAYGGPDKLTVGEQPRPAIGPRELLVAMKAASINPVDYKIRAGKLKTMIDYPMPLILGQDGAGEVVEVGGEVTRFKVGDAVFARLDKTRIGTLAEFAAVREEDAALKPTKLSFEEAASIPLAGLTAWQVLRDLAHVEKGRAVLIHAGSGGVGTLAIQIAKRLGATVATTAGARNAARMRQLGADIVIDYRAQRFEEALADRRIDFVFDTQGGDVLFRSINAVRFGGMVITIGGIPTPRVMREWQRPRWLIWLSAFLNRRYFGAARRRDIAFDYHFMHPSGAQLAEIAAWLESGAIVPVVDRVFPLDAAAEAFAYAEAGHVVGKVVIKI